MELAEVPAARSFDPDERVGNIDRENTETPIESGTWYTARSANSGFVYEFPVGTLVEFEYLALDMLVDDSHCGKHGFVLTLHEDDRDGEDGRTFVFDWACLVQCGARARIPLSATNQDTWQFPREGAWLKPNVAGDRVDLENVNRMDLRVRRIDGPFRWCQTPVVATAEEPPTLDDPALPEGELIDEFGQSEIHDWGSKSTSHEEITDRLHDQRDRADDPEPPASYSAWGGWSEQGFEATGFFRTEHDGERWWLVDPDGHPFWSAGADCVRIYPEAAYEGLEDALTWLPDPEGEFADAHTEGESGPPISTINYLTTNLIRAFGDSWYDDWADVALSHLRELGFNTVGNWSDWEVARERGVPYVRPLYLDFEETPLVYRDFPDVFAESFERDVAEIADQLAETAEDPALVGYFLQNEPDWAFAEEPPAAGMLYTAESCESRRKLAEFLEERYENGEALAKAWDREIDFADVAEGQWSGELNETAKEDLAAFSTRMVDRFYGTLTDACRAVDENHLNLGVRYAGTPPEWVVDGLDHIDVFTINSYSDRIPEEFGEISERLGVPIMIGEWHFGSLEAPLAGMPNCVVETEAERGDAFRIYQEDAAAKPWCVGTHYFTLYDKSSLGRPDGENYNQGVIDTTNALYSEMAEGVRTAHERLYRVADGELDPFEDEPDYLHDLYL